MPDGNPVLVQEESTGDYGLYYASEDVIETYVGDEKEELPGAYVGENWHEADQDDLRASIEAEIEDVREEIEALRDEELTEEHAQELDTLEARLERQENIFELATEADDA